LELDPDTVVGGAEFCVGQGITFDVLGQPNFDDLSWARWTLPGTFVNECPNPTVCDLFYDKNTSLLTREWIRDGSFSTTPCWYVKDFQADDANVDLHYHFSNGQWVEVNLSGQFKVFRPTDSKSWSTYGWHYKQPSSTWSEW
jgi:hypothetical protein